jgi:hypothetical protein
MVDQLATIETADPRPRETRIIRHKETPPRFVADYNEFKGIVRAFPGQPVNIETKFVPIKKGDGKRTVVSEMQFNDSLSGRNIVYIQRYKRDGKPVCVDDLSEEERAKFENSCLLTALHHGSDIYRNKPGVAVINIDNIHGKKNDAFEEKERQEKKVQLVSKGARALIEIQPDKQSAGKELINHVRAELKTLG